jgi:hypothetical protein
VPAVARRRADSAVKADRPRGWIAWRCLLHGDFAFYAWADKPYLIAALRLTRLSSLLGLRRLKPSRTPYTRWW